jgi:enoyl-[acyl-carrier protein] reductase III
MDTQSRNIVITGGTRGIGKSIALKFCSPKTHLILTYLQDSESAEQTLEQLRPLCASVTAYQVNMNDIEDITEFTHILNNNYTHINCLINNAAAGVFRSLCDLKVKHWDYTFDVCVRAVWLMSTQLRPLLQKATNGAYIVNMSSLGANRFLSHYAAIGISKAAVEAMTRYMTAEFKLDPIIVNTVSATTVHTTALENYPTQQKLYDETVQRTPAGRLVTSEDIAGVVNFLCSPEAFMVRGQVIVVDGGFSIT